MFGTGLVVVVAHPDDETIGASLLLSLGHDVSLIHVTDGAPCDMIDAMRQGFSSRVDYAIARRAELSSAMDVLGIPGSRLICCNTPDQTAALNLESIVQKLMPVLTGADIVLTHAYEGGHPDHDAVACCVHIACSQIARRGGQAPVIIEVPLYHATPDGWARQRFASHERVPGCNIKLTANEQHVKRRMLAAFATQHDTLHQFQAHTEAYRVAPHYDFSELPNHGLLLYERYDWGMRGDLWLRLARTALAQARESWAA